MGKKKHAGRKWTAEEEEYLAANYGETPIWVLMRHLKRTESSIVTHACRINPDRRKYASYEKPGVFDRVKELYDAQSTDQVIMEAMRDVFGTADDVRQYRRRHGLTGQNQPGPSKPWTMQEEIYLRSQWRDKTLAEMAQTLGRSTSAVDNKIRSMGLREEED